jgi:hypothetical protein
MNAINIITNEPIKCPTCNGPNGILKNGLARSPNNALTVPYASSSNNVSSASANGCCSNN